jgi:peptidylprolyl isomerase
MAAIAAGVLLLALAGGAVLATNGNDKTATSTPLSFSDQPSTSTVPTTLPPSVAGQPCVPVADPLPPGAPQVPVQVGPPPTALVTQDLVVGTGADVAPESKVTVNYIGVACSTGKIFDSSYTRGQTFQADLAPTSAQPVIPGWQQGIPGMKVGGQRLLGIPPDLAYGSTAPSPDIAPDETLWFVVEVVSMP